MVHFTCKVYGEHNNGEDDDASHDHHDDAAGVVLLGRVVGRHLVFLGNVARLAIAGAG